MTSAGSMSGNGNAITAVMQLHPLIKLLVAVIWHNHMLLATSIMITMRHLWSPAWVIQTCVACTGEKDCKLDQPLNQPLIQTRKGNHNNDTIAMALLGKTNVRVLIGTPT